MVDTSDELLDEVDSDDSDELLESELSDEPLDDELDDDELQCSCGVIRILSPELLQLTCKSSLSPEIVNTQSVVTFVTAQL